MSEVRRGGLSPKDSPHSPMTVHHHHTSPQLLKQLTSPPVVSATNLANLIATANMSTTVGGGGNTPYVLTPSVSGRSSPSTSPGPARKKLKLDFDSADSENSNGSRRLRMCNRRKSRLQKLRSDYKDNMAELFYLHSDGNIFDVHTFRRKPSQHFLTFLASNGAPSSVIAEVKDILQGSQPTNITKPPPPQPPRSVSSAAMAAAVAAQAALGGYSFASQRQPNRSEPTSTYFPRATLMSPVRVGEQLQSFNSQPAAGPSTPRRATAFREQLSEKVKQEAWVVRRVNELTKEGLWSEKRLPKVCERQRPKSHWDVMMQEMRWLAVDYYQERQWKKAAAKMLAESAKAYVEDLPNRRRRQQEVRERKLRRFAGFVSDQVLTFWSDAASEALKISTHLIQSTDPRSPFHQNHVSQTTETHSEENPSVSTALVNMSSCGSSDQDKEIALPYQAAKPRNSVKEDKPRFTDLTFKRGRLLNHKTSLGGDPFVTSDLGLLDDKDFICEVFTSDDESTIAEQELYEHQFTLVDARLEVDTLNEDNVRTLESLLRAEYPGYVPCHESDDSEYQDPFGSEYSFDLDDGDEEEFSIEEIENLIQLPMFPGQQKLYDDFLAGPDTRLALETGNAVSISNVVQTLRKICNHPNLIENETLRQSRDERSFLRIPDLSEVSKLILTATDYDPFSEVDFGSLNLIFLQHETTLTAITFDRIRKCCAPRALIEELPERSTPAPPIPRGRLNIEIHNSSTANSSNANRPQLIYTVNGQQVLLSSSPADGTHTTTQIFKDEIPSEAFHSDSLDVIARFNERRCMGMPLYGQDLLDALTVVDAVKPPNRIAKTRNRGQGYVNCLTASDEGWDSLASNLSSVGRSLRLPWSSMSLGSSGRSRHHKKRIDFQHKTSALRQLVQIIESQKIHSELGRDIFGCYSPLTLAPSYSRTIKRLQDRLHPNLALVRHQQSSLTQDHFTPPLQGTTATRSSIHIRSDLSVKLEKLDELLRQFRSRGERALVFCQMQEMLELLQNFFNERHFSYTFLHPESSLKKRTVQLQWFAERKNILVLLVSTTTSVAGFSVPEMDNVVFFDANWNNNSEVSYEKGSRASLMVSPCLQWCRRLRSKRQQLTVYRLVCEGTVEDTISIKALQERLLGDIKIRRGPENGSSVPVFTINRQTLEALLSPHFNDNGIRGMVNENHDYSSKTQNKLGSETLVEDVEAMAHLDWLWSSQSRREDLGRSNLSNQLDEDWQGRKSKGQPTAESKPIYKYAVQWIQDLLCRDESFFESELLIDPLTFIDEKEEKRDWEERYQNELKAAQDEMFELECMPCLTYSSEDANRTWHGRDGQPMPLWTPPTPSMTSESDLVEHHLAFLYKTTLMEENELPPIYIKKDSTPPPSVATSTSSGMQSVGMKRTASEAGFVGLDIGSQGMISPAITAGDQKMGKYRKDESSSVGQQGGSSSGFAPRSLFERPLQVTQKSSKIRSKFPNRQMPHPSGAPTPPLPGTIPTPSTSPGLPGAIAGLRHPLPRPQVEAESVPEWLVQEDWALLYAVRELQELPVNLLTNSPAHTPNWDLVSDIVNSVSRCYRNPRQCRNRFDSIILPREEGRICDMPPSAVAAMAAQAAASAAANKKSKKKSPAVKIPSNRPMKTSALFAQDNNTAFSALFASRFENIKAVANKRTPTTKPLVVNANMKNSQHGAVLADNGISYEAPLNPIQVAANRAERIQREKQKTQQDQQQQLAQQRTAAAQAAAQAAASAAQQQQSRLVTATIANPQHSMANTVQVQQQSTQPQTVVTSSPHPAAVVVGISQPMTTVNNAQLNSVIQSRLQQQQQQQPQQLRQTQQATIGIQELVRVCSQQSTHSTVVVTSQPAAVVSVASLTPSQLQAAHKLVSQTTTMKGGVVTTQGRTFTPQQMNLLKQQAMMKKNAQDNAVAKARLQGMQIAGTSGTGVTGTVTSSAVGTTQKVTVTGVSLAPSNLVTVVTQAGQTKAHFIRQASGGKSNIRAMTEAEMKLLLASKQQQQQLQGMAAKGQVTQVQVPSQSNLATQLLAGGIHVQHTGVGGATIVKTVTAGNSGGAAVVTGGQVQSNVNMPVTSVNLPQVKAALARSNVTNPAQMQLALRQQIMQQRKPVTTMTATQQKVTLGQVGAKGVPAQLIVSSSGQVNQAGQKQMQQQQQAVTVQQFQQIVKTVQPIVSASGANIVQQQQIGSHGQQIIPHAVFTKQTVMSAIQGGSTVAGLVTTVGGATTTQTSTVQARAIPVSSTSSMAGTANRTQQIQVVTASPTQIQVSTSTGARQISGAPNVTVDATGRPTGTFVNAVGTPHIRVATSNNPQQQQYLTASGQNIAVAVRGPAGVHSSHQQAQIVTSQQGMTKLQVVGPSTVSANPGQPQIPTERN